MAPSGGRERNWKLLKDLLNRFIHLTEKQVRNDLRAFFFTLSVYLIAVRTECGDVTARKQADEGGLKQFYPQSLFMNVSQEETESSRGKKPNQSLFIHFLKLLQWVLLFLGEWKLSHNRRWGPPAASCSYRSSSTFELCGHQLFVVIKHILQVSKCRLFSLFRAQTSVWVSTHSIHYFGDAFFNLGLYNNNNNNKRFKHKQHLIFIAHPAEQRRPV